MPIYRVYRIMEMHGFQDVEANSEIEAVAKCFHDDAPYYTVPPVSNVREGYQINGYGMGDTFYVHTEDGKVIKPQPTFKISDLTKPTA